MPKINTFSHKIEMGTRKFITGLGKGDALAPIILLEAAVIAGRTYHAYDRGGFVEARERGTEEVLGAVFWLGGVQFFNKIGDAIGKKVLKLKDVDFEVGMDFARKPIKNFMKKNIGHTTNSLAAFKFTKIISSILLANAVIGFVVPKINQAITAKYQKGLEELDAKNPAKVSKNKEDLDKFINKSAEKKQKDTSFKGSGVQSLLTLTNYFENDARYKLLSTDVGIAGGRAVSARNKHERREVLFRDLSSIYFYMFCKNHLSSVLNFVEDGKASRLDSMSAKELDLHLQKNLKGKASYTAEEFERLVFGERNVEIPKRVQKIIEAKIKNGIINFEDFEEIVGANSEIAKRAKSMSRIQPRLEGKLILTSEQLKDVYSNGLIDNPRLLNRIFRGYSNKKSSRTMKFYPEADLRALKQQMVDYVESIIKKSKASGESITMETLKKANKANLIKNMFNLGAGFAVSAYFLSTAIPKMQYWITRWQTGDNKFPGVQKYDK